MHRRDFLKLASVAAVGAATGVAADLVEAAPASAGTGDWPGHKPGRIYLGASAPGDIADTLRITGPVGLNRSYYGWGDATREMRTIQADHAALRLPWSSFDPPSSAPGGWTAVASGRFDADLRARARRYAGLSRPVIVTFNHEPHTDNTGTPAQFAAAWTHVHDVMAHETGLKNIISVPIIGDWCYNPVNRSGHPEGYITGAVLDRCHFLGVDLYQNQSGDGYAVRLGRILSWLNARGHSEKMIGVGETGCTDSYGSPSGAQWWTASWNWAVANRNRIGAISYFNSRAHNNNGNNWLLTQSSSKLAAFRASLRSSTACHL